MFKAYRVISGKLTFLLMLAFMVTSLTGVGYAAPSYAKWGHLAVQETQKKYNAKVTDYLHIGRTNVSSSLAEEKFKLIVDKDGQLLGLFVTVQYNPISDTLISIRYEETIP